MNKLLKISCDSFEFNSALSKINEETMIFVFGCFLKYISDDKNKVSKQDLKQLAENISIQDDPAKTA